jgi:hypothetical protein
VRASLEDLAPTHPQYKGLQAALALEQSTPSGHGDQIRMNMERWRWAPHDLGERYILVNVPAYVMQVMEGERPVLSMRVIVGDPEHQTPLFSDEMTYVVFSPYWNIPPDILREETLPRLARDPDFLRRNNIEVVGTTGDDEIDPASIDWSDESATRKIRLRQRPGDDNALGLVKFIFPNNFNVYLHELRDARSAGVDGAAHPERDVGRAGADGQTQDADSRAHRLLDRMGGAGRKDRDIYRRSLQDRSGAGAAAQAVRNDRASRSTSALSDSPSSSNADRSADQDSL